MRHSRAPQGVYITRPERTIWPVIALVATMLFSAAAEAGASFVRGAMAAHDARIEREATSRGSRAQAVLADGVGSESELEREQHAPAGAIKASANTAHLVRSTQQKHRVLPDARSPLRRAAVAVLTRAREVADRRLFVRSFRQTVVSPRSGGLMVFFPTAPPQGEASSKPSTDRHTGAL